MKRKLELSRRRIEPQRAARRYSEGMTATSESTVAKAVPNKTMHITWLGEQRYLGVSGSATSC